MSSHELKCLGKMCCPSVDYTFLGCWASVQDEGSGETTVISVITRLAGSEKLVLQLAHPSWLRQSAICAVSVRLVQRLRPGQRDGFCHIDFRQVGLLTFLKDCGRTNAIKIPCTVSYVLKRTFMLIFFHLPLIRWGSSFDQRGNAMMVCCPVTLTIILACGHILSRFWSIFLLSTSLVYMCFIIKFLKSVFWRDQGRI